MNTEGRRDVAAAAVSTAEPREMLVVSGAEDLHVLGRFFQAMLLNMLKDPDKRKAAAKMDLAVAIDPPGHPDCALTSTFRGGKVILEGGVAPGADIVLRCEAAVLMKLARMPAGPAALRFLMTHEGKVLIARMRSGELKIKGIARHPLGMMRYAKFLAPGMG